MRPLVLSLAALDADRQAEAGGKAANLGELIQAGFPVPPGFCVTTAAYESAAARAGLAPLVAELDALPADADERRAALAERARAALLAVPLDDELGAAIATRLAELGGGPVAVRSSANAEDQPDASFAGQQDTFLHVIGPEAVRDAVRRCWASLWSERATTYRAHQGVGQRDLALAVVVQAMVDARASGVAFSANPIDGRRGEAVVDVSPGLGEAVVSGAVNPDHYVVTAATGAIRERRLGDKRVAIRARAGGGTVREERADGSAAACLDDGAIAAVAALAAKAEAHYGAPQDLEFAFDAEDRLWLLQSRPITTLYPLPEPRVQVLRAFFSVNVAQGVMGPFTPMGRQALRLVGAGAAGAFGHPLARPAEGPWFFRDAGERLFFDVTPILRDPLGRRLFPLALGQMEARAGAIVRRLLREEPAFAPTTDALPVAFARVARAAAHAGVPKGVLLALASPEARRARALDAPRRIMALAELPPDATPAQRLDAFERLFQRAVPIMLADVAPVMVAGMAASVAAAHLLGDRATAAELQIARRALPHNPTTEMDLALAALAEAVAADPAARAAVEQAEPAALVAAWRAGTAPAVLARGLDAFLAAYGHRGLPEIDLGVPRWREDPAFLVGALRAMLHPAADVAAPSAQFRRAQAEAEAMVETLAGRVRGWRAIAVRFLLGRMRALFGLRECPKYNLVTMLAAGRALLAPVGAALAADGKLGAADDVYFLDLAEARAALAGEDQRERVAERRRVRAREERRRHVPRLLLSDGSEPQDDPGEAPAGSLRGTGASPGVVRASARVVRDPHGASLAPGEILVAPSTDPGWTPLFLTAGGLVMEMGGAMSHGAVVAREYGIPAVVGLPGATAAIATGQLLEVDGTRGLVTPVAAPDPPA